MLTNSRCRAVNTGFSLNSRRRVIQIALATIFGLLSATLLIAYEPTTTNTNSVAYKTEKIEGLDIFYREAGPKDAPTVLLLHGFPTSTHMFRNLIPQLADKYHVIAPDYPGYGNSSIPSVDEFEYTFENMATIVDKLVQKIGVSKYSLYLMDYGSNPAHYQEWQAYMREHQPPTLIVWGQNDPIFPAEGAHPYKRDLKNLGFNCSTQATSPLKKTAT